MKFTRTHRLVAQRYLDCVQPAAAFRSQPAGAGPQQAAWPKAAAGSPRPPHFGRPLAMPSQRCLKAALDWDNEAAAARARPRFPASQS